MSASAKAQVKRMLALTPYLRARAEGVPLRTIAEDFGVKPEQIVKDLKVLWFCGLPGLGPDDLVDIDFEPFEDDPDGLVRIGNADFLPRPLRLGSTEASALIVALRALREGSDAESREIVDRVLDKLEAATATAGDAPVTVLPTDRGAGELTARTALLDAINRDRQVRLDYFVPTRDEHTSRVIDPISVLTSDGKAYVDGWCHQADDRRLFRIDRIDSVELLETPRAVTELPPRDLSDGLFEPGPDDQVVSLRLAPRARWIADYYPTDSSVEGPEGALDVTLRVGDPRWLVRLVLGSAPAVSVLSPSSYVELVRDAAQRALDGYAGGVG